MTKTRAARITGLEITVVAHTGSYEAQAWDGDGLVAADHDRKEKHALASLVERVYRQRSLEVMYDQGWLCAICGQRNPLEIDHIKSRARGGRDDRRENLRAVCAGPMGCGFHHGRHGGTFKKPVPVPPSGNEPDSTALLSGEHVFNRVVLPVSR